MSHLVDLAQNFRSASVSNHVDQLASRDKTHGCFCFFGPWRAAYGEATPVLCPFFLTRHAKHDLGAETWDAVHHRWRMGLQRFASHTPGLARFTAPSCNRRCLSSRKQLSVDSPPPVPIGSPA